MAAAKKKAARGSTPAKRSRARKPAPGSRGLTAGEVVGAPPASLGVLAETIRADGGSVIGSYRDPLGGHWQLVAALPVERVKPTPFQRDLSDAHVKKLSKAIGALGRFLDPPIVVRSPAGEWWTPNGYHRTEALKLLGAKTVVVLVVPEAETAYQILALNTEKAHNLREKSLEVVRMARSLAETGPKPEKDYEGVFEEAPFLTLGPCYEENGRFAGGAYHSFLKRVDAFLPDPLPKAIAKRVDRARGLLELDEAVSKAVAALKARGLESPYLKAFVVARVNPVRFLKGPPPPYDAAFQKMLAAAKAFDPGKIKADQIARSGGAPAAD